MSNIKQMIIDGQRVAAKTGRTYALHNPANGTLLAQISDGDGDDVEVAIASAHKALGIWSKIPAKQRGILMKKAEHLLQERAVDIARLITLENGKPFEEAQQEVLFSSGYLSWFAEEGRRAYGDWIPSPYPHKRLLTLVKPVGVVAAITPWNFPANMITRKIAPAIAAGCTVVLKPADTTPLTALALGEIFIEAGIPAGVFNIVTAKDPAPISEAFFRYPEIVRMITFTGSVRVGKLLAQKAAERVMRVDLELGGNAPVIVYDDADFEKAVDNVLAIKFLRVGGESCICANRIYVQASIYDKFIAAFSKKVQQLKVGDGFMSGAQIGPLITQVALQRVAALVDETKQRGGCIVTGGHVLTSVPYQQGNFYTPTVIADCQDDWPIAQQEIFGPVACFYKFSNIEEVLARANHSVYGLAAYVFSQDMAKIIRSIESLEYGFIGVNDGQGYTHEIPVGGLKESGIGREGGKQGLWSYLEVQSAVINLE
ncbi:MAG: succinate-semialdehyde dehydrogenase (NADP(+)) [Gammaproteobacteria bacterium RIFCSPHIGHO2_12_FULL_41_20]|nr:MAG: succinate-semialdehyde dehydrogenase (NADP(+)) [Gammaproteobacteria bacterium RIFCSPHIGHO2_12_FULL_41_20]